MSVRSITARSRRRFTDTILESGGTCKVTKPGDGPNVPDLVTLQYTHPARVTVYEGPCRWQVKVDVNSNVVETTAGDREWTYLTAQLQVPVETPVGATGDIADIRPDMIAEATACDLDLTIVGRLFNIQGIYHKSQASYRRFRVREVIS